MSMGPKPPLSLIGICGYVGAGSAAGAGATQILGLLVAPRGEGSNGGAVAFVFGLLYLIVGSLAAITYGAAGGIAEIRPERRGDRWAFWLALGFSVVLMLPLVATWAYGGDTSAIQSLPIWVVRVASLTGVGAAVTAGWKWPSRTATA